MRFVTLARDFKARMLAARTCTGSARAQPRAGRGEGGAGRRRRLNGPSRRGRHENSGGTGGSHPLFKIGVTESDKRSIECPASKPATAGTGPVCSRCVPGAFTAALPARFLSDLAQTPKKDQTRGLQHDLT